MTSKAASYLQGGAREVGADHLHATTLEPTFVPVPSESPLGEMADISMGWDGTLWGTTADGVPHLFDPIAQAWSVFGRGIDAIAWSEPGLALVFRGDEYTHDGEQPQKLADTWPQLPGSFQLGVDGAANVGGVLYLFKAGRYARADMAEPAAALTGLTGWPQTDTWREGIVDGSGSSRDDATSTAVTLFRRDEFLVVDMAQKTVVDGPYPLSARYGGALLELMLGGIDAATFSGSDTTVYQGPLRWDSLDRSSAEANYLTWWDDWYPRLDHAPSGRCGSLWCVGYQDGVIYTHDGGDWSVVAWEDTSVVLSVAASVDGYVYAIADDNSVHRLDGQRGTWPQVGAAPMPLRQVSAGDGYQIFVRDEQNQIHRFTEPNVFTPVDTGVPATHMAASFDGTVWHCDGDSAHVYRHLSATTQSQALAVAQGVAGVKKVATTGFGIAHVLADEKGGSVLYRYESPYLMKTAGSYQSAPGRQMAVGAGCLFFSFFDDDGGVSYICIDAQTGQERWRRSISAHVGGGFPESVFDPQFQVVYLALEDDIAALGVQDGAVVWRCAQQHGALVARPALRGSLLCFATDTGAVIAVDTAQAYQSAQLSQDVAPLWTWAPPPQTGVTAPQPPLIADDAIYVSIWHSGSNRISLQLLKLDTATSLGLDERILWNHQLPAQGGTYATIDQRPAPPVYFPSYSADVGPFHEHTDTVLVAWDTTVYQFRTVDGSQVGAAYDAKDEITSGLSVYRATQEQEAEQYDVPVCVFGTQTGTLRAVQMGPVGVEEVWGTPFKGTADATRISTTPYVRARADSTPVIWFGITSSQALWAYDTATSAAAQLGTGATALSTLVPTDTGVVYAGGYTSSPDTLAQYFAIRLDGAVLHDFVAESELMEDRDGDANQRTRYQTHVVIVDEHKIARPSQAVKIWAEDAVVVEVDGKPHSIDAGTPAVFQTDATGSFTVVSDATDTFAVPLRLWAEFMDPHERIVVYPDREFHQRLADPKADPNGQQQDEIDPTRVNLSTAEDFSDGPLCDSQHQAESTAQAIQQTWATVQHGDVGASAAQASQRRPSPPPHVRDRASQPRAFESLSPADKYVAYGDLPGVAYFAVDTPATRPAAIVATTGFELDDDHNFTPLSVADAAASIDALEGEEVLPTLLASAAVGGFLKDLWKKIKSLGAAIKKVVVSIGREVYAGFQYLEQGVLKVVRAVVHTIDDIASLIGAFFVKLGKEIAKVVEALTVLFHFKEILATADAIKGFFTTLDDNLSDVASKFTAAGDQFFKNLEQNIDTWFDTLIKELDPSTTGDPSDHGAISDLSGVGTTTHSAFTVGPKGQQSTRSHAVQCSWAAHKLRQHYKQATTTDDSAAVGTADPFARLLTDVITGITADPELKRALDEARAQFHLKLKIRSADDFLRMAAADLLEVVKVVAITALAVVKALVDALAQNMVTAVGDLGTLEIPVLSPLWKALTGNTLTFLDVIAFVGAIPVTIVYRIVEGAWPAVPATTLGASLDPTVAKRLGGLVTGIAMIFAGWFTAILDALYIASQELTAGGKAARGIVGATLLVAQAGANIWHAVVNKDDLDVVLSILSILTIVVVAYGSEADQAEALTFSNVLIATVQLSAVIPMFLLKKLDLDALTRNLLSAIPIFVNPLKFAPADTLVPLVAPMADATCRAAVGGTTIAVTIADWD